MNFLKLGRYILIILMVQFPVASFSQEQINTSNKIGQQGQIARPRLDAVQLLEHARRLSDDARGLKPLDEILLQARLADVVWPLDQSLGERLLARSFGLTTALLKESPDPASTSSAADPQSMFAHISAIASKHDPKLEQKLKDQWQEATASVSEINNNKSKPDPTQPSYLLLGQSANYLKTDEPKARQLFRQSVSLRVTQDHCFFLLNQRKRAPEITDTLFGDTLAVLANRPLTEANEVLLLSSYLFSPNGSVGYVVISGYNTANVAANMSAVPTNRGLAKRYLALLLAKMSPNETVPSAIAYFALKNLLPQYQAFAPELLNDVYAKMGSLAPNVSKDDSAAFDYSHKSFTASESEATADWEKRIEKADKLEPEDWRDLEYFTILFGYLLPKKDFGRATIIVGRMSNQELKDKSADLVSLNAIQTKLEKDETASSISEADCYKIKNPLVRVVALGTLGKSRLKQKATGDALRLVGQAVAEANQINDEQDQLQAKLMLVQLSLDADSFLGFERATEAVKAINKFADFNMNRSEFSLRVVVYGLKNELPINTPAPSSLTFAVTRMCSINCEETFQISRRLEKTELRLWATFVAVRTGLRQNSKDTTSSLH